jgi:ribosomal protein S18 acetylase RimI-like enzyme
MNSPVASGGQHRGTFWVLDLDQPLAAATPARVAATFRRLGPEQARELVEAMGLASVEPLLQRFARGGQCYGAYVEEARQLAAYGWVSFQQETIGELGLTLRLREGTAYIWDCATLPPYRGRRLYPALLRFMAEALRRQGIRRLWIGADADNHASHRGIELAGFRVLADVLATQEVPPRLWLVARPGAPAALLADLRRALPDLEMPAQEDESFAS